MKGLWRCLPSASFHRSREHIPYLQTFHVHGCLVLLARGLKWEEVHSCVKKNRPNLEEAKQRENKSAVGLGRDEGWSQGWCLELVLLGNVVRCLSSLIVFRGRTQAWGVMTWVRFGHHLSNHSHVASGVGWDGFGGVGVSLKLPEMVKSIGGFAVDEENCYKILIILKN